MNDTPRSYGPIFEPIVFGSFEVPARLLTYRLACGCVVWNVREGRMHGTPCPEHVSVETVCAAAG